MENVQPGPYALGKIDYAERLGGIMARGLLPDEAYVVGVMNNADCVAVQESISLEVDGRETCKRKDMLTVFLRNTPHVHDSRRSCGTP